MKSGVKCVDSNGNDPTLSESSLEIAKETAVMFYDECGEGTRFMICPRNSRQVISTCGRDYPISGGNKRRDILYIKGKYFLS